MKSINVAELGSRVHPTLDPSPEGRESARCIRRYNSNHRAHHMIAGFSTAGLRASCAASSAGSVSSHSRAI